MSLFSLKAENSKIQPEFNDYIDQLGQKQKIWYAGNLKIVVIEYILTERHWHTDDMYFEETLGHEAHALFKKARRPFIELNNNFCQLSRTETHLE